MNNGLDLYENEQQVASIHGYIYSTNQELPETFFLRGADCWGWATWRHSWELFEPDANKLLRRLKKEKLTHLFDLDGTYPYSRMLRRQITGEIDSWAICWHASAFLEGMLTLYPGRSLVNNIGNDNSGTNSVLSHQYQTKIEENPIRVERLPCVESETARREVVRHLSAMQSPLISRIIGSITKMAQ